MTLKLPSCCDLFYSIHQSRNGLRCGLGLGLLVPLLRRQLLIYVRECLVQQANALSQFFIGHRQRRLSGKISQNDETAADLAYCDSEDAHEALYGHDVATDLLSQHCERSLNRVAPPLTPSSMAFSPMSAPILSPEAVLPGGAAT